MCLCVYVAEHILWNFTSQYKEGPFILYHSTPFFAPKEEGRMRIGRFISSLIYEYGLLGSPFLAEKILSSISKTNLGK